MIDCVGAGSITHLCATSSFRLLRNLSRQKFALASRGILDVFFEVSRIKAFPPVVGGTSLGRSLPRACPVASSWLAECAKLSQGQDVGFPCRIMRRGFAGWLLEDFSVVKVSAMYTCTVHLAHSITRSGPRCGCAVCALFCFCGVLGPHQSLTPRLVVFSSPWFASVGSKMFYTTSLASMLG